MKNILLIIWAFLPLIALSQKEEKIKLTGYVNTVSYHQGGVQLPDEYLAPNPYQVELFVIELIDSTKAPKVVTSFETDEKGYFEIELPKGKYGFVTSAEKRKLKPGQVLPEGNSSIGENVSTSTYWTTNETLPLELSEAERSIIITYYNTSTCFTCP